jgi:hypothetical protein
MKQATNDWFSAAKDDLLAAETRKRFKAHTSRSFSLSAMFGEEH